jgi:hypothetical protein
MHQDVGNVMAERLLTLFGTKKQKAKAGGCSTEERVVVVGWRLAASCASRSGPRNPCRRLFSQQRARPLITRERAPASPMPCHAIPPPY